MILLSCKDDLRHTQHGMLWPTVVAAGAALGIVWCMHARHSGRTLLLHEAVSGEPQQRCNAMLTEPVKVPMRAAQCDTPWSLLCIPVLCCRADTPLLSRFAASLPGEAGNLAALAATYPLRRLATPEEIAEAAVWACTKATFMTGHTLVLDGGVSCT